MHNSLFYTYPPQ